MTSKWNDKITKFYNALMNRINASINTHNSSNSAHSDIREDISEKQDTLVSGTNIKTINGGSLLGAGNISVKEGAGTFLDLQGLINSASTGDTIVLDKDYKYNSETDSSLTNGITINRNLTIIGNGHILDGNNEKRIFYFPVGAQSAETVVSINGITFINGYYNGDGGAVYILQYNKISISDCNFSKNSSKSGLAIKCLGNCSCIISNCNFNNNFSSENSSRGVFACEGCYDILIINCSFNNNKLTGFGSSGGAINCQGIYNMYILNCVFNNNELGSSSAGGAIICFSISNMNIFNCDFNNNHAGQIGGAIYNDCSPYIKNCNFKDNSAPTASDIYSSSDLIIYDCNTSSANLSNVINYNSVNSKDIITSWQNTPLDTTIPSEKLVKDTIDNYIGDINDYIGE